MYGISDRHRKEIMEMLSFLAALAASDRRLANLCRRTRLLIGVLGRKKPITKDNDNNI